MALASSSGHSLPPDHLKRPTGVTVLAVLVWVAAGLIVLGAVALFAASQFLAFGAGEVPGLPFGALGAFGVLFAFVLILLAVAYAVTGWGLWTERRWAWYVAGVLTALSLLSSVVNLFQGEFVTSIVSIAIAVLIGWYLLRPEVQSWFGVRWETPWKYRTT